MAPGIKCRMINPAYRKLFYIITGSKKEKKKEIDAFPASAIG
jgi:hypothetical protein